VGAITDNEFSTIRDTPNKNKQKTPNKQTNKKMVWQKYT